MKETVGAQTLKAAADTTKYDPLELGHALTDDLYDQLCICADTHDALIEKNPLCKEIFHPDQYCIVAMLATDVLIPSVIRRKITALPFIPDPRPSMAVFLYNRHTQKFRRLWSLPNAKAMASLSTLDIVDRKWTQSKSWCDAFYEGTFFEYIKADNPDLKILPQPEWISVNHKKFIKPTSDSVDPLAAQTLDPTQVAVNKVIDSLDSFIVK